MTAVVGGKGTDGKNRTDGEAFDPQARTWQPLPPVAFRRGSPGVVAVAGGLLAVGSNKKDKPNELFDEASGRWFKLPHPMAEPRYAVRACVVSLPAASLAPPAAAAAPAGGAAAAAQ